MPWSDNTYGTGNIKKHNYEVYARQATTEITFSNVASVTDAIAEGTGTYEHVGGLDEKPFIENQDGDKKKINSGAEMNLSENIVMEFSQLEVTQLNYKALRDLATGGNVDVLFWDADGKKAIAVWAVPIEAKIKITGNDFDVVKVTCKKEVTNFDDHVEYLDITAT